MFRVDNADTTACPKNIGTQLVVLTFGIVIHFFQVEIKTIHNYSNIQFSSSLESLNNLHKNKILIQITF